MSLAKNLEEELTCPVHLEYFEEPLILKCLHSLCKKEVKIMMKDKGHLICPVCKSVSKRKDIKQDFRTQKLIDVIKQDRLKGKKRCQFCQEEAARRKCRECKLLFCGRCSEGHLRMPTSAHHHFMEVQEIIKGIQQRVECAIVNTEDMTTPFRKAKDGWESVKIENDKKISTIEGQIDGIEGVIMGKVRRVQEQLRKDLHQAIAQENERADALLQKASGALEKFNKELSLLNGMRENEDTLLDRGKCELLLKKSGTRSACVNTSFLPLPVTETRIALTWRANEISTALKNIKLTINEVYRETKTH